MAIGINAEERIPGDILGAINRGYTGGEHLNNGDFEIMATKDQDYSNGIQPAQCLRYEYLETKEDMQRQAIEQYKAELVEWLRQEQENLQPDITFGDYIENEVLDKIIQHIEAENEQTKSNT